MTTSSRVASSSRDACGTVTVSWSIASLLAARP